MILKASIEYKTSWGEQLVFCLGGKRHVMRYVSDGLWSVEVDRVRTDKVHEYTYELMREGKVIRREWKKHDLVLPDMVSPEILEISDVWYDHPADAPLYSSAFTKAIFARHDSGKPRKVKNANVLFKVNAPSVRPDEVLALAGSGKALGEWTELIPFDSSEFPVWTLQMHVNDSFAYKLVVVDKKTMAPVMWETGENRVFPSMYKDGSFRIQTLNPRFCRQGWRGAGTVIPVFSLRSEDDFGVGEFLDLKKMVDWAVETGQSVIQLLPINDTTMSGTWNDSYPYNPNSTFALHPQYINLPAAGVVEDDGYLALQAELNSLEQIDYEKVNKAKIMYLRKAFDDTFTAVSTRKSYKEFVSGNSHWLIPYAAFCILRDKHGTPDFTQWKSFAKYNAKRVEALCESNRSESDFWFFVQYHLDLQLSQVCSYAHQRGVVFKGDLPIGISRTSVDAWVYPELFNMDSQAGAPPDAFSALGQNWGFPTYNWSRMAKDGFAWWKARLAKMSEYFDAFRIDHILGFFRIWEIPLAARNGLTGYFNPAMPYTADELKEFGFDMQVKDWAKPSDPEHPEDVLFIEDPHKAGFWHPRIEGHSTDAFSQLNLYRRNAYEKLYEEYFYHRHNGFWKESAMKKLPELLASTGMLACGEDLGMIPACVPDVMADQRILSLEIQRMPKIYGQTFGDPASYPYLSVCTTSTHDMNPIRAWWEEDKELTQRFYNEVIHAQGEAPAQCDPWICREILISHLASPAMFAIIPLQDWLSMDPLLRLEDPHKERINEPANSRHYWRYRMHLTIERLMDEIEFNDSLTGLIVDSGRC